RTLAGATRARVRARAATAAIDVAQSSLDLQLRHRPQTEIDLARFELWVRQVIVDEAAGDIGGVRGDIATLEWIRDRFSAALDPAGLTRIDAHLVVLRESLVDQDLGAIAGEAASLLRTLDRVDG
ncbi:MAG: hypothetical protein H0W09_00105, partial [Solirubrobacterales bacterium]|nr:hypothetical protein [Solirubrobacterales bacterium]